MGQGQERLPRRKEARRRPESIHPTARVWSPSILRTRPEERPAGQRSAEGEEMSDESAGPWQDRNGELSDESAAPGAIREVADGVYLRQEPSALSPSLWKDREAPAFELKFQLFLEQARAVARWAAEH